jgi:hypothetical protein
MSLYSSTPNKDDLTESFRIFTNPEEASKHQPNAE